MVGGTVFFMFPLIGIRNSCHLKGTQLTPSVNRWDPSRGTVCLPISSPTDPPSLCPFLHNWWQKVWTGITLDGTNIDKDSMESISVPNKCPWSDSQPPGHWSGEGVLLIGCCGRLFYWIGCLYFSCNNKDLTSRIIFLILLCFTDP